MCFFGFLSLCFWKLLIHVLHPLQISQTHKHKKPQSIQIKKWQRWSELQVQGFIQHSTAAMRPTTGQSESGGCELVSSERLKVVTIYSTNSYGTLHMCQALLYTPAIRRGTSQTNTDLDSTEKKSEQ